MKIETKTTKTYLAHSFGECVIKLNDESHLRFENISKRTYTIKAKKKKYNYCYL